MQEIKWNYKDIKYKEHVIKIGNLYNACYYDVVGNYSTAKHITHIDGFIEQIEENKFRMSIISTTKKYILTLDDRDIYTSFEDCIKFLEHCIEVFLYD